MRKRADTHPTTMAAKARGERLTSAGAILLAVMIPVLLWMWPDSRVALIIWIGLVFGIADHAGQSLARFLPLRSCLVMAALAMVLVSTGIVTGILRLGTTMEDVLGLARLTSVVVALATPLTAVREGLKARGSGER